MRMRRRSAHGDRRICLTGGERQPAQLAGYALLAIGVLILFLCIPCWAWLALLGAALVGLGILLLTIGKAGR